MDQCDNARHIDFKHLEKNKWLAINQFTVIENHNNRRPDAIVFINGLPLIVIEPKNTAGEKATIRNAFNQIQTYKQQIPSLFIFNEMAIISDGLEARAGTQGTLKFCAVRLLQFSVTYFPAYPGEMFKNVFFEDRDFFP